MEKDRFIQFQKRCLSVAAGFGAIYFILSQSEGLQKALWIGFPWFRMFITIVMLLCAGLSGMEFIKKRELVKKIIDDKLKGNDDNI